MLDRAPSGQAPLPSIEDLPIMGFGISCILLKLKHISIMNEQHDNTSAVQESATGFLLNTFTRTRKRKTVVFAAGRLSNGETFAIADDRLHPIFYIRAGDEPHAREALNITGITIEPCRLTCMDGGSVVAVSSPNSRDLHLFHDALRKRNLRTYEGDLSHYRRYLMTHNICGSLTISGRWKPGDRVDRIYVRPTIGHADCIPVLSTLSIDIETDMDGEDVVRITAIALVGETRSRAAVEEIHLIGKSDPADPPSIVAHPSEASLMMAVFSRINTIDPDIITGWNVIDFDIKVMQERAKVWTIPFDIGRSGDEAWYQGGDGWGQSRVNINGRVVLDAMHLVRAGGNKYDDYSLNTVATAVLGKGKTISFTGNLSKPDALSQAFRDDRQAFCDYCLEDARLVLGILEQEKLIELVIRRSQLTGMPMDQTGSIAPFEFLYIRELHKRGIVAPTVGVDRLSERGAPGGLVMSPSPGLYKNCFVFDFKSLYPSIIRTLNIDPLAHVKAQGESEEDTIQTVNGAHFSREPGILPSMLDAFFEQRQAAKDDGNIIASYTYKIIMNSFYGVLGTDACRFSDGQLVSAITESGHYILRWSRGLLEQHGCRVLYGDTDSLFVDANLPDTISIEDAFIRGNELCQLVNQKLADHIMAEYHLPSKLELEFETFYRRLLLPPARGSGTGGDVGRAKGYAGQAVTPSSSRLEIKGLEAVRRDWTDMAHHLQEELLKLLFADAPPDQVERFVTKWVDAIQRGEMDHDLICRKSLRKDVDNYTKSTPPHVKAAMLLDNPRGVIHYLITTAGPQPISKVSAPIDYRYYIDKQVAPIVRTLSQVYPINAHRALTGEQDLFSLND
ncbi:hypothetical protein BVX99_01220 [bacterium F16]|nr:hypothetical protein BVX99_01220 [bacterium F16]